MAAVTPTRGILGRTDRGEGTAKSGETDTLTVVQASFAGRDELIERAYRESPLFRDLCEDYRIGVAALHRWRQLEVDKAPPRWQEYAELVAELGGEIEDWLEAMGSERVASTDSIDKGVKR